MITTEPVAAPTPAPAVRSGWSPDLRTMEMLGTLADLAWFQVDAQRNVVAISASLERLTGFDAAEVLGRPCIHLQRCQECLRGCGIFEHGRIQSHRMRMYRPDGSELEVVKSGTVLLDEQGAVAGAVELLRPVRTGERGAPPCPGTAAEDEAMRIVEALRCTHFNRTRAAAALGMSRTTLWRKMREYGL